jgi:hypothetical protein
MIQSQACNSFILILQANDAFMVLGAAQAALDASRKGLLPAFNASAAKYTFCSWNLYN